MLPPEELASLGNKKICDPESLRIFATLKARAVSHISKTGVRFLGGWAIPDDQTDFIHDRLDEVRNEFLNAKETFLANYDLEIKNWVDKHPGWERLIAGSAVSVDQVRRRLGFGWQFYKVVPPEKPLAANDLNMEVAGLGQTLFGEIAKDAQSVWSKVYAGKTEVSHKALSPLKAMRHKLMNLSFVEPLATPIVALIDGAISNVPKRGLIRGQHLLMLQGLVSVLRDPESLREHGEKVLNGQASLDTLSAISQANIVIGNAPVIDVQDDLNSSDDLDIEDLPEIDIPMDQLILDGFDDPDDSGCPIGCPVENDGEGQTDRHSKTGNNLNIDSLGLW
jgi:hypothetical protein